MIRSSFVILALLTAACTSVPTNDLVLTETKATAVDDVAKRVAPAPEPAAATPSWALPASEPVAGIKPVSSYMLADPTPTAATYAVPAADALHQSRWTLKGGIYAADADELDDGYIISASWMRFFTSLFALEIEVGYLSTDEDESGIDIDLWAIPIMVNGRANIPLWILDVYGGLGIGTFYYDAEVSVGPVSGDDDGFILGGNIFLGATINLAEAIAMGLELKYYVTEDLDDIDESLDAFAALLTIGFSR